MRVVRTVLVVLGFILLLALTVVGQLYAQDYLRTTSWWPKETL